MLFLDDDMFYPEKKIQTQLIDIQKSIHQVVLPISKFKAFSADCPGAENLDFEDFNWKEFRVGEAWGGYDQIFWFRTRITIPPDWIDQKVVIRMLPGPRDGYGSTAEAQLYVDGEPIQAFDRWHDEACLPSKILNRGEISVALRCWSGMFEVPPQRRFTEASLILINQTAEKYYFLANTLLKTLIEIDSSHPSYYLLLNPLNQSINLINFFHPKGEHYYRTLQSALEFLQESIAKFPKDLMSPSINAIGHAHIDMAWMWQSHHTREKARRTFSTVLHLMDQYPDFQYLHTSPQLYKFLLEDDPKLFARIQKQVEEGRWEPTGGMWVESDTIIPNGESLVRQILFGKRYFKEAFNRECTVLWLPDSFGFSWVLPQLMVKSGLRYFASSVIHWSRFNRFPYDTFYWRGMDGSQVLVMFFTSPGENNKYHYTYNGLIAPYDVRTAWENYRQKEINHELLMPFGWGDGGGGPTVEMLESIQAQTNLPGHPSIKIGSVESYFSRLEKNLLSQSVPVWDGELYNEDLQGAYTSQARLKRANRLLETLFHDVEWYSVLFDDFSGLNCYPQEDLNQKWERFLHLQFHDILPGTSIHEVTEDALRDYADLTRQISELSNAARIGIKALIKTKSPALLVFNNTSWEQSVVVEIPWSEQMRGKSIVDETGYPLLHQDISVKGQLRRLFQVPNIPTWGYHTYPLAPIENQNFEQEIFVSNQQIENRFYRINFNAAGQITALFDKKSDREVLVEGQVGNSLMLFDDRPKSGEAWVIDPSYQDKVHVITQLSDWKIEEVGPLRGVIRFVWQVDGTTIQQRVILYRDLPVIDFETVLDWHHHQMMLKVSFPVNIRSSWATYDIQFGNIERPTHQNTSYDQAHFENPAQKWADLSEEGYGVALINDCKIGYDIRDHCIRLTLHRSPTEPDPNADQGVHNFTYRLFPHPGNWRNPDISKHAYGLNSQFSAQVMDANDHGVLPPTISWAKCDEPLILETLKKAEDDRAWIIRLYENQQMRKENVCLRIWKDVEKAFEVNLMEEEEEELEIRENCVYFSIRSYEVKTIKIWLVESSENRAFF